VNEERGEEVVVERERAAAAAEAVEAERESAGVEWC